MLPFIRRWGFSLFMMAAIFAFSSTPSRELPNFGSEDFFIKKGGHMLGYGLLSLSFWRGLRYERKLLWLSWILSLAYALSDEYHQSFVPGRHPSIVDAFVFDGGGAALALLISRQIRKPKA